MFTLTNSPILAGRLGLRVVQGVVLVCVSELVSACLRMQVHVCMCTCVYMCVRVCMCRVSMRVYSKRVPVLASSNLTDKIQPASPFHPRQIQVLASHQVGPSDVLPWESVCQMELKQTCA